MSCRWSCCRIAPRRSGTPSATICFPLRAGKQQAFAATLARYGLTPAQCMAFGDSDNDIGLLTAAGIGVAMEAGTDGARAAADFVTRDCEADGIRYALEYFSVL